MITENKASAPQSNLLIAKLQRMLFLKSYCSSKNTHFIKCCHCFRILNELLGVDFKLYFDAHIATNITATL